MTDLNKGPSYLSKTLHWKFKVDYLEMATKNFFGFLKPNLQKIKNSKKNFP